MALGARTRAEGAHALPEARPRVPHAHAAHLCAQPAEAHERQRAPPRRREQFVELLQAAPRRGGGRLVLEEAREVQAAVGPGDAPTAVQLLAFRSSLGADTVGVKRLRGPA
jgi:hypothetical protein